MTGQSWEGSYIVAQPVRLTSSQSNGVSCRPRARPRPNTRGSCYEGSGKYPGRALAATSSQRRLCPGLQCSTQGIDEEKLERVAPVLRKFDMFQPVEFESWALGAFTGLEDLCVVQAPKFGRMTGLRCFRLENLTLIECGLKRIEGIEACLSLRRLCLDGNLLSSLSGIEHLTSLTHLHVNDNRLASLAGVSRCTLLRELWAASNQVSSIGDSLDGLSALETINLSANALGTFQVGGASLPHLCWPAPRRAVAVFLPPRPRISRTSRACLP